MRAHTPLFLFALLLALDACKSGSGDMAGVESQSSQMPSMAPEPMPEVMTTAPAAEMPMDFDGKMDDAEAGTLERGRFKTRDPSAMALDKGGPAGGLRGGGSERGPAPRAWFPETFLFEPLLVTDQAGAAEVEVRVPDRLTTWRVLALAHSRQGAQAGALTSFLGTLPAYVDPVVPPRMRVGDRVRLPIQVVNTTAEPMNAALSLEAAGAALTGGSGAVTIPAHDSVVRYATLLATQPGQARLLARLGQADMVVRTLDVVPTGRPITQTRSGTLAAPRSFELTSAQGAEPGLSTSRARLTVFPGALAILRSELAASGQRGGLPQDAFSLLLAGKAPEFLRALGDEPDSDALRKASLLVMQRIMREARTLDMSSATLLAEAALAHPDNPVLVRLGLRAVQYIEHNQTPDGTCGGDTGWPLQRLLVATAECARAARAAGAPASAQRVPVRASGAFERHAEHIKDPYTAAAVLASGAVAENLAQTLRRRVRAAIVERPGGAKALELPAGVVRADGVTPTEVEATALAVLALQGDASAPLADLGATILAGYSPGWGWGDGRANLVGMQAALALFKDPVPDSVSITLHMDGEVVARGTLDRDRVREVMVLEAVAAAGAHTWEVRAEPQVPGLGFSFALQSHGPWPRERSEQGVELEITPPRAAAVGKPAELRVQVAAPSGRELDLRLALPVGVQVDPASLEQLQEQGAITRYQITDAEVGLWIAPLAPAQFFSAAIRVIPTLAGTVHSGAATLTLDDVAVYQPPQAWTVTP